GDRQHDVERTSDVQTEEPFGRDPDDGDGHPVDPDVPSDDVLVAGKARLPEPIADDRDGRCTAPVVGRRDRPATSGPHPKHVEKAAADERAVDALLEAAVRQVEAVPLPAPGECRFGPLCLAIANLLPERV